MKKTTLTILLTISCHWLAAQCPTEITFSTQGQIDSFPINHPLCTQIFGNVTIEESLPGSITHLDSLSQINYITNLKVHTNAALTSLSGLNKLTSIGAGGLSIHTNPALTSLSGLDSLASIGGILYVYANDSLANLNGLDNLTSVGGSLVVSVNSSLTSLNGLNKLIAVDGGLSISDNHSLINLNGLHHLSSVGLYLSVGTNNALTSLNGLDDLTALNGDLLVYQNPTLMSMSGLDTLTSVGGYCQVYNNASLASMSGLGSLISVGNTLLLYQNPALTDLDDLNNLVSVGGVLDLGYNDALTSLSGLENLTTIGGGLSVYNNNTLTSLSGLDNMDFSMIITGMLIVDNPQLFLCDVQSICDYLLSGGPANVSSNAPGCNSVSQIKAACLVSTEEMEEPVVTFSPNPANDFLQIQTTDQENWEISLFDLQGRLVYRQSFSGSLEVELKAWPSGLYALRAVSGKRVFSGKVVKQ